MDFPKVYYYKNNDAASGDAKVLKEGYDTVFGASDLGFSFVHGTLTKWNTNASGTGTDYEIGGSISGSKDLYAVWTNNTYTVTFDGNGGTSTSASAQYPNTIDVSGYTSTRTGYAFAGWYTATSGGTRITGSYQPTANTTLYAHWTANAYAIAFNANGGSGSMANLAMTYDVAKNLTANAFTRTGHTFAGWANTSSGAVAYADKASVVNLATSGTKTLYAKWAINKYTISATCSPTNGGSVSGTGSYDYGTTHTVTATANTGYSFTKWEDNTTAAARSITLGAANKAVTAYFTAHVYNVAYALNGGTHGTSHPASGTYNAWFSVSAPTRAHYRFDGWTLTASDNYGTAKYSVTSGVAVTIADNTTKAGANASSCGFLNLSKTSGYTATLTASWTIHGHTVTFNANGGTGTMATQTINYNTATALSACAFTRSGYTFLGWATSASGETTYGNQQTVTWTDATQVGTPKTLYAKWRRVVRTVLFDANGGVCTDDVRIVPTGEALSHNANICTSDDRRLATPHTATLANNVLTLNFSTASTAQRWACPMLSSTGALLDNLHGHPLTCVSDISGSVAQAGSLKIGETISNASNVVQSQVSSWWPSKTTGVQFGALTAQTRDATTYPTGVLTRNVCRIDANTTVNFNWRICLFAGLNSVTSANYSAANPPKPFEGYATCALPTATRTGYAFANWWTATDGGTQYTASTTISSDVTAHAHWTANTYTVRFDFAGGSCGDDSWRSYTATYDTALTLLSVDANPTPTTPTRAHYRFKGWRVTDGLNATTAKWGTNATPATAIASADTVCYNGETGAVYFKNLTPTQGATVTITALWERISYQVKVDNTTDTVARLAVSCTDAAFTHWNGTQNASVSPAIATTAIGTQASKTFTMYAGCTYRVTASYVAATRTNGTWLALATLGGANMKRTNSGSVAPTYENGRTEGGVWIAGRVLGDNEAIPECGVIVWTPGFYSFTASVGTNPLTDKTPTFVISQHATDTTGRVLSVTANFPYGLAFASWTAGSHVTLESTSVNPAKATLDFQGSATATLNCQPATIPVSVKVDDATARVLGTTCSTALYRFVNNAWVAVAEGAGVPYRSLVKAVCTFTSSESADYAFDGWYDGNGNRVSTSIDNNQFTATDATVLVAKFKSRLTLNWTDATGAVGSTVSAHLSISYKGQQTVYESRPISTFFTIGEQVTIGVTPDNSTTHFVAWYDASDTSYEEPLDLDASDTITVGRKASYNARMTNSASVFYVACYDRRWSGESAVYDATLGLVALSGNQRYEAISKADYNTGLDGNFALSNDGRFYKFYGTQKITLRITKTGSYDYLRLKRGVAAEDYATTDESLFSYEATASALINNHYVFVSEFGDHVLNTLTTRHVDATHLAEGAVDVGATAANVQHGGVYTSGQYEAGDIATAWAKPNNGYAFSGWYADAAFTRTITAQTWTMPSANITVYAKWIAGADANVYVGGGFPSMTPAGEPTQPVRITLDKNYEGSTPTILDGFAGDVINAPQTPTRTGYGFAGWYTDSACTIPFGVATDALYSFVMPASNITLYARFAAVRTKLCKWEGSPIYKRLTWLSKVYALTKPASLTSIRVDATAYPVARTVIASYSSPNTAATSTIDLMGDRCGIDSQDARRLPTRRPERYFQVQVESTSEVDAILVGTSGEGLAK